MNIIISLDHQAPQPGTRGAVNLEVARRNGEIPKRPAMKRHFIEAAFDDAWFTPKRDNILGRNDVHLFANGDLDQVAIWFGPDREFRWADLKDGSSGETKISLACHVLEVDQTEAAWRMACLMAARRDRSHTLDDFFEKAA